MTINVKVLEEAVEWVEAQSLLDFEKRVWDQDDWYIDLKGYRRDHSEEYEFYDGWTKPACNTAMCIAGYVAHQYAKPLGWRMGIDTHMNRGDDRSRISDWAQDYLGLTEDQAENLFDGGNKAEDIRRIANELMQ